jgi:predicted deacetylase
MAVHVSIHDVSPAWEREVEIALEMVHEYGVAPALLVVPDFHGKAPLLEHPRFCERLRSLERSGHEIYLHGYYHRARAWDAHADAQDPKHAARGVVARARYAFAQRVVSGGEAEFSDVSRDEARTRIDAGERVLREAGLTIRGFVAPAWSMPRWVLRLLGERRYSFTEDHMRVYDPAANRSRASLVLNYASRTPGRLLSSVAWCRLARPARRVFPARIAIHPADVRFALLRSEIRSLLEWARNDFAPTGSALLS